MVAGLDASQGTSVPPTPPFPTPNVAFDAKSRCKWLPDTSRAHVGHVRPLYGAQSPVLVWAPGGPASTRRALPRGGDPARAPGRPPGSLPRPALWGRRLTEHNSRLALEKPCGPAPGCRRPQPHVSREPASVPLRAGSLGPRRPALPSGTSAPGARGQAPTGAWASSQPDAVPTRRLGLQVCLSVAVFGGTCPSRGSARPRRVFVLSLSFLPPT